MTENEILNILGREWTGLTVYRVDEVNHWLGCEVVELLGLSSTTQAIKGTKDKPKLRFPAFRMHMIPEVNQERAVYLLTLDGIIQVIKKNRNPRTKVLKVKLEEAGL